MKPNFCPIEIFTTVEELCSQANLIANFEALENIANYICCIDNEINAFSSRKIKPGDNINLIAIGGVSWSWTGPNSFASTAQNPSITNATSSAQGLYQVTITDSDGCTHLKQVYVFVDQPVCITVSDVNLPDPSTIDEGVIHIDTVRRTINILCGGVWEPFPLHAEVYLPTDLPPPDLITPANNSYAIRGQMFTATDGMNYFVDINGNAIKFAGTNIYNANGTLENNRTVDGGNNSLLWTNVLTWAVESNGLIGWNSATGAYQYITLPPLDNTLDKILIIDDSGNLHYISKATVFGPLLNSTFDVWGTTFVCVGDNINLFADGGDDYSWAGPNGFASTSQNPVIASTGISVETGVYTCVITDTSSGISATKNIYVHVVNCAAPQSIISSNSSF